jgi:hypothetical protein
VFVSSTNGSGDLGGLAGANATCNTLASGAGLPGTFAAWISASGSTPANSFTQDGRFVLVNGSPIANSWAQLTSGSLLQPINLDESGNSSTSLVWTNTDGGGNALAVVNCNNFTSGSPLIGAYFGNASLSSQAWTNQGSAACSGGASIYCFEQ